MVFLTEEHIAAEAEKSNLAATTCSRVHWEQIRDCTPEELVRGFIDNHVNCGHSKCALCIRFELDCVKCPLGRKYGKCPLGRKYGKCQPIDYRMTVWSKARDAFKQKIMGLEYDPQAFDDMINQLKSVEESLNG